MAAATTSSKVTAASTTAAGSVLIGFLLDSIPWVASWPTDVKGAALVLVTGAASFTAGFIKKEAAKIEADK